MQKKLPLILVAILLTGCQMRLANRLLGGGTPPSATVSPPTATEVQPPTQPPTATLLPPPTITPSPAPDPGAVGLPPEAAGSTALDFAADVCNALWSNTNGDVICDANDTASSTGYVMLMSGEPQGLPSDIPVLLMYPPQDNGDTLSGKYPAFAVQKGDRFRVVLACRLHTFCDVDFGLDYFDTNGRTSLARWSYLFTDKPQVIDYSLDGIAGRTVQFSLVVRRHGAGLQAYAVWIMPHIYRPVP